MPSIFSNNAPIECVKTQSSDHHEEWQRRRRQQQQNVDQLRSVAKASAPSLQGILIGAQVLLIPFFFFAVGSPAVDFTFDVREYIVYRDIMAMLLLGFGYLMTFLKSYGLSAVGLTMLLTALTMQASIPMEYLFRFLVNGSDETSWPMPLHLTTLIDAEFAAATILISFGALIGRTTPLQLAVLVLCETALYAFNKVMLVFGHIDAEDVGGTITIHMFGAYFGLAVSYALGTTASLSSAQSKSNNGPDKVSDILAMIGTTILWVYWPSFVGATETAHPENEMRCVSNTILALLASTLATFTLSHILGGAGKFDPVHIANSTLAGGVAIGSIARLDVGAGGAVCVGCVAGILSVLGYRYSSPYLESKLGLLDTCGVGNLHGYPSLLGGLLSAVYVAVDADAEFLTHGTSSQVVRQLLAVLATLLVSLLGGYTTGKLLNCLPGNNTKGFDYQDLVFWEQDYNDGVADETEEYYEDDDDDEAK